MKPQITAFFDEATFSVSYVAADAGAGRCAVIDPVLGFDAAAARTDPAPAERIADFLHAENLNVEWILETHVHADHFSAAPWLKERFGGKIAIGAEIAAVQETFGEIFNAGEDFARDGGQFDALMRDGDVLHVGGVNARAIHTPGHTPACMTYLIGDAAFVGDTLFMPDYGTARADFPGGDARTLYRSIQKLFALPDATRVFVCHDYKAPGRNVFAWETTVGEQRRANVHIHDGVSEEDFAAMRAARDKTLSMPRLMLPAVQVNMRAGHLPPAEPNGARYLKLPIDRF